MSDSDGIQQTKDVDTAEEKNTTAGVNYKSNRDKEEEMESESNNWRKILEKLNDQVRQVTEMTHKCEILDEKNSFQQKDFLDIKLQYRRIKIQEQCRQLRPKVRIPSRSSWRDRIDGNVDQATVVETRVTEKANESPHLRRKKTTLEMRRTKTYEVDKSIDIHKIKIADNVAEKRIQIEKRLVKINNQSHGEKAKQKHQILFLTFPGYDQVRVVSDCKKSETSVKIDFNTTVPPKGRLEKTNKFEDLIRHKTKSEIPKKLEAPPPPKKNYCASVDWREELKNRDKAKQLEALAGFTMGMPDYKEPEPTVEEQKQTPLENKWTKTGKRWEKVNLKPTIKPAETGKANSAEKQLKINLKPVNKKNNVEKHDKPLKIIQTHSSTTMVPNEENCNKENIRIGHKDISHKDTRIENKTNMRAKKENISKKGIKSQIQKPKPEANETKYTVKIINFVAIKVALEEPCSKQEAQMIVNKADESKEGNNVNDSELEENYSVIYTVLQSEECDVDESEADINKIDNAKDFPHTQIPDVDSEKNHPQPSVGNMSIRTIQKKDPLETKDVNDNDCRIYKPRRKRMIDYFPEPLPRRIVRKDAEVTPMNFSSVADNCVTTAAFVGSHYTGNN